MSGHSHFTRFKRLFSLGLAFTFVNGIDAQEPIPVQSRPATTAPAPRLGLPKLGLPKFELPNLGILRPKGAMQGSAVTVSESAIVEPSPVVDGAFVTIAPQVTSVPSFPEPMLPADGLPAATANAEQPAPAAQPAPPVLEAAACECPDGGVDWSKVPSIVPFARPGFFGIFHSKGCGYYSLHDLICHEPHKDRPKFGYTPFALQPPPMFDIDWRYLENPKTPPQDFLEKLHRIHVGDHWLVNTGGEFRWRHMHEVNSRLSGVTNEYDLFRTRVYADVWYDDRFRASIEFFDAQSFNQNLPPSLVDVDRSDFYNAFLEAKIFDGDHGKAYVRAGRQELLLGSQRLVSPPEWNNTRRTFDGVRGYYTGEKWDFNAFWVQPVIPDPSNLDSVDNNQNFAGLWLTHRPDKGQFRDLYYMFLDNTNRQTQQGVQRAPFNVHTVGARAAGDKNRFLYDFEGMVQFGERGASDIFAASATAGVGYHFECLPMSPIVWAYYDYASGDNSPNQGNFNTFNQLFPFGHYYMGWLDLVARQNIHDINAHLYFYPTKWITVNMQYHHFELASKRDALYNAAGAATRRDPTGNAGRHVGDEIDLIVNFHLTRRSDILVGYSHMFAGDFIERTGPGLDPSLFYAMFNYRW